METWVEELPKKKFFPRVNTTGCLVTISMLISNRIDTVEKCFESFRPLLEQIPSEFIAVDTVGDEKSDGSIDVARRYADKIVHFEWCDDFAAARNAGLKEARGKWLIYLDDDEWFDNIEPLIDFFSKTELYENYDRVYLIEHNYTSSTQINYVESKFSRISAINSDSHFVNPVHEILEGTSYEREYKLKDTFVHHVGYIGKTSDLKAKRNKKIMDRELEKNPGNLHLWLQQIAGENNDKEMLLEISNKAVNTITMMNLVRWDTFEWIELFLYRMNAYARFKMWSDLEKSTEEFNKHVTNPFYLGVAAKINLSRYLDFFDEKEYKKWLILYVKAVIYFRRHGNVKYIGCFTNEVTEKVMYSLTISYFDNCKRECSDSYARIKEMILEIPWKIYDDERKNLLAYSLKEAINAGDEKIVNFLAKEFFNGERLNGEFVEQIDRIRIELESDESYDIFNKIISNIKFNSETLWLMMNCGKSISQTILDDHLNYEFTASFPNECLIEICIRNNISPQRYVERVTWEDFVKTVDAIIFKESRNINYIPEYALKIEEVWEPSAQRNYLLAEIRKRYIFQGSMVLRKVLEESEKYCQNMIEYAKSVYTNNLFDTESILLPSEVRFAILFGKALECRKENRLKDCLAYLQKALEAFKYSESLIKRIIQSIELDQRKNATVNDEMIKLGNQVKSQIIALISQGQNEVAAGLLKELKQITPEDPDLATLEKLCQP